MTKDLAITIKSKVEHGKDYLYTEEFLEAIDKNLKNKLSK
jgi:isocitrate dehydrogenase